MDNLEELNKLKEQEKLQKIKNRNEEVKRICEEQDREREKKKQEKRNLIFNILQYAFSPIRNYSNVSNCILMLCFTSELLQ